MPRRSTRSSRAPAGGWATRIGDEDGVHDQAARGREVRSICHLPCIFYDALPADPPLAADRRERRRAEVWRRFERRDLHGAFPAAGVGGYEQDTHRRSREQF